MNIDHIIKRASATCCVAALMAVHSPLQAQSLAPNPWMAGDIIAEQSAEKADEPKEAIANRRAKMLIAAMSLPAKDAAANRRQARNPSGITAMFWRTPRQRNSGSQHPDFPDYQRPGRPWPE